MVYAEDSKPSAARLEGSSPSPGTLDAKSEFAILPLSESRFAKVPSRAPVLQSVKIPPKVGF
jgi:hypothetical protein